jgi:hypothetical protein
VVARLVREVAHLRVDQYLLGGQGFSAQLGVGHAE